MHEFAVAQHLVQLVETQAFAAGATRVTQVNLTLGEQSHVVTESLDMYFKLLTAEAHSPAEGATLHVERTPMRFFCAACELEYLAGDTFKCPKCHSVGTLTDPGDGLLLESLEVTG